MIRIVFRGLILFKEEDGELRALLVNDEARAGHGIHAHRPRIGVIGWRGDRPVILESGAFSGGFRLHVGKGRVTKKRPEYQEFVPNLPRLYGENPTRRVDLTYVASEVRVTAGVLRPTTLVSWPPSLDRREGVETPALVEFMKLDGGGATEGHVANECVLEAEGNELKIEILDRWKEKKPTIPESLLPLTEGITPFLRRTGHLPDDRGLDAAPDTIEILITNFAPQRSVPVPWSLHYQLLYRAAGYPPRAFDGQTLSDFIRVAKTYHGGREWEQDTSPETGFNLKEGYPFPFLPSREGKVPVLPPTPLEYPTLAHVSHDPWNRPLCPQGDD